MELLNLHFNDGESLTGEELNTFVSKINETITNVNSLLSSTSSSVDTSTSTTNSGSDKYGEIDVTDETIIPD